MPFPNGTQDITVADSLKALDLLFKVDIDPKRVAAIIIEPVQGEGGFNITPPELMTALRKVCDEHGILLIADEVQTGFGRTGKLYAMEHHSVQADLITMAKSLGGGMPISGVVGRADVMDAPPPAAAAPTPATRWPWPRARGAGRHRGRKTVRARRPVGRQAARAHLEGLRAKVPGIADVRGLGSMVALELNDPSTGKPDADAVKRVQARAMERGLILLSCGVYGNVLRFLYP